MYIRVSIHYMIGKVGRGKKISTKKSLNVMYKEQNVQNVIITRSTGKRKKFRNKARKRENAGGRG